MRLRERTREARQLFADFENPELDEKKRHKQLEKRQELDVASYTRQVGERKLEKPS